MVLLKAETAPRGACTAVEVEAEAAEVAEMKLAPVAGTVCTVTVPLALAAAPVEEAAVAAS